ncbi:GSCOCG00009361001-RA-CDS [Cotesia congregata]|nr:GSCOCG00009361001-RA-CDS [Cotesia congregata]
MDLDFNYLCKDTLRYYYPLDIHFYSYHEAPSLNVQDFIPLLRERIIALKVIAIVVSDNRRESDDYIRFLAIEKLKSIKSNCYISLLSSKGHKTKSDEDVKNRMMDHTSFLMLVASIISNRHRFRELMEIEEKFFKLRTSALDDEGLSNLLEMYNDFPKIEEREKEELKLELIKYLKNKDDYNKMDYFKIPINNIICKMNPHEFYLNKGIAYVPFNMMRQVLCAKFHHLIKGKRSNLMIESIKSAEKSHFGLSSICNYARTTFTRIQESTLSDSGLTEKDIDHLSETGFPPCMRHIHQTLRKNHHLKHEARLQYTLFLKGIGLNVKETIKLFKGEFTQRMDIGLFEREYRYYIEHAYGLRGRRKDYPPQECHQIQSKRTPRGDCNGCPLQIHNHIDIEDLDQTLIQWQIPKSDRQGIIEESKNKNPGTACALYFEAINDCKMKKEIDHPNDYYNRSRYAQYHCISEFPFEDDEIISSFSRLNMSTGITEYTEYTEYTKYTKYTDCQKIVKDQEESNVACNIKKRNSDEIVESNIITKKVKINSIDVIKPSVLPALPVSSKLSLEFYKEAEELEFIKQFTVAFLDDIIPIENIKTASLICIPSSTCPPEHK